MRREKGRKANGNRCKCNVREERTRKENKERTRKEKEGVNNKERIKE